MLVQDFSPGSLHAEKTRKKDASSGVHFEGIQWIYALKKQFLLHFGYDLISMGIFQRNYHSQNKHLSKARFSQKQVYFSEEYLKGEFLKLRMIERRKGCVDTDSCQRRNSMCKPLGLDLQGLLSRCCFGL